MRAGLETPALRVRHGERLVDQAPKRPFRGCPTVNLLRQRGLRAPERGPDVAGSHPVASATSAQLRPLWRSTRTVTECPGNRASASRTAAGGGAPRGRHASAPPAGAPSAVA